MPRDYRNANQRRHTRPGVTRARRHVWYARLVIALVLAGLGAGVYLLRGVMLPFVIAGIIVFILAPLVQRMQNRGIPRWAGVILSYIVFFSSVVLFSYYLVPKLEHEARRLIEKLGVAMRETPKYFRQFEESVEDLLGSIAPEEEVLPPPPPPNMRWGRGPQLEPIEEARLGGEIPFLSPMRYAAEERAAASILSSSESLHAGARAATVEQGRSNLVLTRIREGQYGVRFNESSIEVEHVGEGRFNLSARAGRLRGSTIANLRDQIIESLRAGLERLGGKIIGTIVDMAQALVGGLLGAVIGIIVTFMVAAFLLIDLDRLKRFLRQRVPERYRKDYDELLHMLNDGFSGVIRGQLMICVINGVLSFLGFLIFIPEYAIVMGILAGVMSLIPIFGTIISTIPAVLIGLTVSFGTALAVLFWILGVHFLDANIITPRIVGRQAEIHPALIMFAIIAGQQTFGAVGALLAVPVISLVQSVIRFAYPRAEAVLRRKQWGESQ